MIRMFFKEQKLRLARKVAIKGGRKPWEEDELYTLELGGRIPTEIELRKMVTPEEACVTEATAAAQARLKQRGIVMNESSFPM